ncbi:cation-dependent mannose-6-phosphate receptor-like isoform X2 [Pseudomyrmex gracilis]|uniref:cation-dependent mannose-6-phosphate receptor-like isoform X2 n=1 Tax=Pseudomyrmex gracilis TaxID=219809 RepID=UPI000995613D|nr:cation-dependent mannose-6-phosphate receptor-like isoform X2 [Pseudomyrmex gracilis]
MFWMILMGPLSQKKGDWTVKFHPCTNIKLDTLANCTNTSLCTYNNNSNSINLGRVEETQMKLIENEIPVFEIHHENVTSRITIMCTRRVTFLMVDSPNLRPNTEYYFTLASPHGCKLDPPKKPINKGLSTGSVLVVLFFTFAGVYFIGGIMAMKFLRGATGWEMLPNHDFWCELPSLVRDGVIFACNCCRADSYERI